MVRVLLLQIREDQFTREEELAEFIRYSGLPAASFGVLDAFQDPITPDALVGWDVLFIGGSSDASVRLPERYPFVKDMQALLRHCLAIRFPVLASCFGFQVAVVALGGQVILDEAQMELGTFPVQLTAAAQHDPLLWDAPSVFPVMCGHKERVAVLPPQCVLLASSERCIYQAFRVGDQPFYGFQFHPELDRPDLQARLRRYATRYRADAEALEGIVAHIEDTPMANSLIRKFLERIVFTHL